MHRRLQQAALVWLLAGASAWGEPPHVSYIFPAGGQRGTKVNVRVGGHFLHERANFEMLGEGVTVPAEICRTETIWFEGPLIKIPASQAAEDYPQDFAAEISLAADAKLGNRWWRCWNAQGVTPPLPFVVGELPEVVEQEIDGAPLPVAVAVPVTINGRIFPREDEDVWTFDSAAGQTLVCSAVARDLGSPLVPKLAAYDPSGKLLAESTGDGSSNARLRFTTPKTGRYSLHITDVASGGLQHYVYRLTVAAETDLMANAGELVEAEPNETLATAKTVALPSTIGGRIQSPGDLDGWSVELKKEQPVTLK